jgi:hypothetical protein
MRRAFFENVGFRSVFEGIRGFVMKGTGIEVLPASCSMNSGMHSGQRIGREGSTSVAVRAE